MQTAGSQYFFPLWKPAQPTVWMQIGGCGDGKCEGSESSSTCAKDCPSTGPVCGNGQCESGESTASCVKDCPAAGPSCVGKCGGQSGTCYCDELCTSSGDCCADYQSACGSNTCTPKCAVGALCGTSDGCGGKCAGSCSAGLVCNASKVCVPNSAKCGNGICETGESTTSCASDCKPAGGSCSGLCGKASSGCYCDSQCKSSNDCCADYDGYCPAPKGCAGKGDQDFLGGLADPAKSNAFKVDLSDCTLKKGCLGKANATAKVQCIADCMDAAYAASGISKSCSACYGLTGYCAAGPCLLACIDSANPACSTCVAEKCDPATNACKAGTCDPYGTANCGLTK